ncbi:phage antirepressor KilAC domain-containing protein [Ruminococcus albus]|uniref:phage antirepressor KilAC domain-containing protein n=1 Tax=Ruminococcus albus TaxID=1264 RepID=UPI0001E081F9|nr:phage antirepressor [Ruminococcus albus]
MNDIKIYENAEFGSVRTLEVNGEPYFVGKDVADILGYQNGSRDINRHVDTEDKADVAIHDGSQNRNMTIINESGLYSLILSSKLPKAKEFKHWVTSEVLPSIRKHGAYMTDDVLHRAITEPDFLIQLATELKEEQEKRRALESTVAVQNQQITELQPKASYYDVVLNSKDLLSIGKIAKDFGKSAVWLNKWLHEHGVQYKQGEIWLLYQKYAEQGYTNTKTQTYNGNDGAVHTKVHTYWTQKGRLFIYDLLKAHGVLPLIERTH